MSTETPPYRSQSLDELLQSNQETFDQLFERQRNGLSQIGSQPTPVSPASDTALEQHASDRSENTSGSQTADNPHSALAGVPVDYHWLPPIPEPGKDTPASAARALATDRLRQALAGACEEMAAVVSRDAVSWPLRRWAPEAPMIADAAGRMLSGRWPLPVTAIPDSAGLTCQPGDIILASDPYCTQGAAGHPAHWLLIKPVFLNNDELIGYSAVAGPLNDVGAAAAGRVPVSTSDIFAAGVRIPAIKLFDQGQLNEALLALLMNNTRTPDANYSDLLALISACRTGAQRLLEIAQRSADDGFPESCSELLAQSYRGMAALITRYLPEEPRFFTDTVDDDGFNSGPLQLKLSIWREGKQAYFDWTGTAAQAAGPVNFYLNEDHFKRVAGQYLSSLF